jgi:VanZ family protein
VIVKPLRAAVLWLGLVLALGSAPFGPGQTQRHIVPVLRVLAPWMPASSAQMMHGLLRKLTHFTEYAILALLWARALRSQRWFGLRTAWWVALAICVTCATADEVHQSHVPGRHGSVRDVAIDSAGALSALILVRRRQPVTADSGMVRGTEPPLRPVQIDRNG